MWVGKFALSDEGLPAGGVAWVDLGTTAAVAPAVVNGAAYHPTYSSPDSISALYVTTEAVAASDAYIGGFRYRLDGALRVYDATSAVPAGANTNQGIALTSDGQLCYTTGNTTSFSLNGVAVDTERRVYAAPLAFELQFADAGAGVVSTVEAITAATPTFTRATTATTVLSTGLIGSVASGDPRSYYDPTSLTYLGYLAEGARTNLCLQSEDFETTWTQTDTTVAANAAVAPDGTTTADSLTQGTAGNALTSQAFTITADANVAISRFVKQGAVGRWFYMTLEVGGNGAGSWFDIQTATVGTAVQNGTGVRVSASMKQYPNGWLRLLLVVNIGSGETAVTNFSIVMDGDNSLTRLDNAITYQWGAQLEDGVSFASSYIPTTTAAVARNADVLTYPTTGWFSAAAGTIYSESRPFNVASVENKVSVALDDGTTIETFRNVIATATPTFVVTDGGVIQALPTSGTATISTNTKIAAAYAVNDFAISGNGAAVGTDTSGSLPTVTTLSIGHVAVTSSFHFGPIRRVSYYAARLGNATLQGLTA